jgi:hypothetical protein
VRPRSSCRIHTRFRWTDSRRVQRPNPWLRLLQKLGQSQRRPYS